MERSAFAQVVAAHAARYPRMEPRDYGKLAFQSEFGPEHLLGDPERLAGLIQAELEHVGPGQGAEDVGGGLCRLHLDGNWPAAAAPLLAKLMALTARETAGTRAGLEAKLSVLEGLSVPGMKEWLGLWRGQGCPPVHHSEAFRTAYQPHYRLVKGIFGRYFPALLEIASLLEKSSSVIVAIDGRCGSGKTGLAGLISELFQCAVIHMDDFYLPVEQREENWREVPAGNMDLERVRAEALLPVREGKPLTYRAYDCQRGMFLPAVFSPPESLTIVEGSYSLHPLLRPCYDGAIFLTCSRQEQERRLRDREGDYFPAFQSIWMPLEERYFKDCAVEESASLVVDTTTFFD